MDLADININFAHYRRLRATLFARHNAITKALPRPIFQQAAKSLGVLRGKTLTLGSEGEMQILFDYAIYSPRINGLNFVQRFLTTLPPTDDPDEQAVQTAMGKDRFSMFQAERVLPGMGLEFRDLVRGDALFVVDEGLSRTMHQGVAFGGRLIPFSNFWIVTGAGFPMSEEVVKTVQQIFLPTLKLTEGKLADLSPAAHEELATVVIGAAMRDGTTSQIEYR